VAHHLGQFHDRLRPRPLPSRWSWSIAFGTRNG
jgi:hypothetical protein